MSADRRAPLSISSSCTKRNSGLWRVPSAPPSGPRSMGAAASRISCACCGEAPSTEKYTFADPRSLATRTSVSVIMPRRGSRTSRRISSLNVCWICCAMRLARGNALFVMSLGSGYRSRHFDARVALDLVADPHVVVVLHADAALGAGTHFVDVVLEATQRLEAALEDHDVVAQHADRIVTADIAFHHDATRDRAELAGAEYLAHLCDADDLLLDLRREHARQHLLHVVDRFVNDAVVANVGAGLLDHRASRAVGAHVEADDPRIRRHRQRDVGFGDAADTAGNDLDRDLVGRQLRQRIAQRLGAALHV